MAKVSKNGLIMTSVYLTVQSREKMKKLGRQQSITAAEVLRRILEAGLAGK